MLLIVLLINSGINMIEILLLRLIVVVYRPLPVLLEDLMQLLTAQVAAVALPLAHQG